MPPDREADDSRAAATSAGTGDREEPLLEGNLAAAAARGAGLDPVISFRSCAAARAASVESRDDDRRFVTVGRLLEGDFEVVAKILPGARPAAAAAEDVPEAEQVAEDVPEVAEDFLIEARKPGLRAEPFASEAVVALATGNRCSRRR